MVDVYGVGPVTAARWVRELRLTSVEQAVEFYLSMPREAPPISSQSSVISTSTSTSASTSRSASKGSSPNAKRTRLDRSSDFYSASSEDEDEADTSTLTSAPVRSSSQSSAAGVGGSSGGGGQRRRALGMSANLRYGLAFHEQLVQPVPRARALSLVRWFRELVRRSLGEPNARVVVAGGFRRGKPQGHDIDILLTHPTPGMSPSLKWTLIFSVSCLLYDCVSN